MNKEEEINTIEKEFNTTKIASIISVAMYIPIGWAMTIEKTDKNMLMLAAITLGVFITFLYIDMNTLKITKKILTNKKE